MADGNQEPPGGHADDDLAPGALVGEYQVIGKIGQGGMGSVYRVVHPIIGKKAAVKVVGRELSRQPDAIRRFTQEAQAVNQIAHPNIVDIFALGTLPDGRPYFVMELLDGESLGARVRRGQPPLAESVSLLEQICAALEATHAQGIIHRDLKPDNVFIDRRTGRDVVKLLDFGIAKLDRQEGVGVDLTRDGATMGTPAYLSPELARGRKVDARSDIYSLGIIAFELLLGRLPFDAESAIDLIMMQVAAAPPRPSKLWPQIPPELEAALLAMLDKEPDRRPPVSAFRMVLGTALAAPQMPPPATRPALSPADVPAAIRPTVAGARFAAHAPTVHSSEPPSTPQKEAIVTAASPYKCKGSHVVIASRWVDERLGPGAFKELVRGYGDAWSGIHLPMTWFEVDPLCAALTVVAKKLGRTLQDITVEITRLNALEDLTSMYRFFLRIAAPQRVMGFTPRLWGTYVAFGEARAVTNEPGYYIGECTGIPQRLLEWTCGAWRGFVPTAIELSGGKDVRGTIRGTWPMDRVPGGAGDLYRLELEVRYKT